jgi:hypothetical protein
MSDQDIIALIIMFLVAAAVCWGVVALARAIHRRPHTPLPPVAPPVESPPATAARTTIQLGEGRRVTLDVPLRQHGPVIRRGGTIVFPTRPAALWQEKGWRQEGTSYTGRFRAGRRSWRGLIEVPYPGAFQANIWDPPLGEIERNTHHRPCFRASQRGRGNCYTVHYYSMPSSLDHAISTIERLLTQAVGG